MLNNRRNKYIKQRNHPSIFIVFLNYYKRKGGYWIIYQPESDRLYHFFFFYFFNVSKVKVNSIIEPYAMRKKCLYGCSIISFLISLYPLTFHFHHASIEETFFMLYHRLYHQGNDPSTR